jgi:hypothetical protein
MHLKAEQRMRFDSSNVQFITPRTMSEIDLSRIPPPPWPWPVSLDEYQTRMLEESWTPQVKVIGGCYSAGTYHYVAQLPTTHANARMKVHWTERGHVRVTPLTTD